jgi:ribulose-phosphate 3-epimerase
MFMSLPYIIAPSILSADFTRLGEQVAAAEASGADWIHVDVMDGHFVPNLTMGPFIVEHVRRVTSLPIDVHLMVANPDQLLDSFASAGATNLTVHVETCPDPTATLKNVRRLGCKSGLTLNPATPAMLLTSHLPLADLVLVMTVHPGYSGQSFMPEMIGKIREVRCMLDELDSPARLEVDGGISAATIRETRDAGADAFVAAHAVFKHPDGIAAGIAALRESLSV